MYQKKTWKITAPMNNKRDLHTLSILADGKVLATGGRIDTTTYLKKTELYDPATGTWRNTGSMQNT
jgi:hypothetical protein